MAVAVLFAMSTAYYAAPAKADLRQAAQAFENGDYESAKAEWHRLAERGEAEAEFGLGEIYEQANGDYKKAEVWYGKAAEHGSAKAEYRLALISMAGNEHSPPDIIKAYKWASLAAEGDGVWSELGKDLRGGSHAVQRRREPCEDRHEHDGLDDVAGAPAGIEETVDVEEEFETVRENLAKALKLAYSRGMGALPVAPADRTGYRRCCSPIGVGRAPHATAHLCRHHHCVRLYLPVAGL